MKGQAAGVWVLLRDELEEEECGDEVVAVVVSVAGLVESWNCCVHFPSFEMMRDTMR